MQYATIHIQANPFVSIWFSRFENCNLASSSRSSSDMRERERDRPPRKPLSHLSLPPLLSSPLCLPSRTLWCIGGRKTRAQAEAGGGGRQLHCSPILVRADSHEQRRSRANQGRRGGGGGEEAEDRWIRATIGIVDFVIRGFYEERVIERGRTRNGARLCLAYCWLLYCWIIRNGFVLRGLIGGQIETRLVELSSRAGCRIGKGFLIRTRGRDKNKFAPSGRFQKVSEFLELKKYK